MSDNNLSLPLLPIDDNSTKSDASGPYEREKIPPRDSFVESLGPEQKEMLRKGRSLVKNIALVLVTVAFIVAVFIQDKVVKGGLCLFFMGTVWVTELIPLSLAGILPIFLYSFTGIANEGKVAKAFWNSMSFLFSVGFLMGAVVERWDLHRRVSVSIVLSSGESIARLLFMVMFSLWFLSMWMNNAAAILCMFPVIRRFLGTIPEEHKDFRAAVLLACAWSSSVGGMATITGSLTNIVGMGLFKNMVGEDIGFGQFMLCALPLAIVNLFAIWLLICCKYLWFSGKGKIEVDLTAFRQLKKQLGVMKPEEKIVSIYLFFLIATWCFAKPLKKIFGLPMVNTASIGVLFTLPLFFIPARTNKIETIDGKEVPAENVLDWNYARSKFKWEILFIFGGGYMVAYATEESGFIAWAASQFGKMPELVLLACTTTAVCFLTELVSNMACIQIFAPIIAEVAYDMGYDPLKFLFVVVISASFAFMLPMASGPNMIAYGTGKDFSLGFMARNGFALNIITIVIGIIYLNYVLPSLLPKEYTYQQHWSEKN